MRVFLFWVLALGCWVGSIAAWIMFGNASADWQGLGPNPSNADIYPIENNLLLGSYGGIFLSLAALIFSALAGRRLTR